MADDSNNYDSLIKFVSDDFDNSIKDCDLLLADAMFSFKLIVKSVLMSYGHIDTLVLEPLPDFSKVIKEGLDSKSLGKIHYSLLDGFINVSDNELVFDNSFVASRDEVVRAHKSLISVINKYEGLFKDDKNVIPVSIKLGNYFSSFKNNRNELLLPTGFSIYISYMYDASKFLNLFS